jgi:hypothetical protein
MNKEGHTERARDYLYKEKLLFRRKFTHQEIGRRKGRKSERQRERGDADNRGTCVVE